MWESEREDRGERRGREFKGRERKVGWVNSRAVGVRWKNGEERKEKKRKEKGFLNIKIILFNSA